VNLIKLIKIFSDNNCKSIYVKALAPNDNSKNQIYFGGNFEVLNIFPIKDITTDSSQTKNTATFKSKLDFYWLNDDGELNIAPNSQFILYPEYPEVRFSGFLLGCKNPPSNLMTSRIEQRLLFIGVNSDDKTIGYVTSPESNLANEFNQIENIEIQGVFKVLEIQNNEILKNSRKELIKQLKRIHELGWIESKKLSTRNEIVACNSSNCGGYTLEAELGIIPNGNSEPDYLGWELKQFKVKKFETFKNEVITLMTPEPTGGFYRDKSLREFLEKYGYADKRGREDRMNFGGVHKCDIEHSTTGLKLILDGFDKSTGKINNPAGSIILLDKNDTIAASWSFTSLMKHWNQKHNKASYIPSISETDPIRKYAYGNQIILGTGTDFILFLQQMALGNIYYDPGIKIENFSSDKPTSKKRSQFRIKSGFLKELYRLNEIVDVLKT